VRRRARRRISDVVGKNRRRVARRQRKIDLDGRSPGRWYRRNRRLLQHALGRCGESCAVHTPQHCAARQCDLDRRQGDRRGEGVGD
jgi:hypothetical protein